MTFYRPEKHERIVYQDDRWMIGSIRGGVPSERNGSDFLSDFGGQKNSQMRAADH